MSLGLFRKPKRNIRQRIVAHDSDEEENGDEPDRNDEEQEFKPSPKEIISTSSAVKSNNHTREKSEKTTSTATLLSFADEEDDAEVFKIKKSSHSRRLARQLEKERKKKQDSKSDEQQQKNSAPPDKKPDITKTLVKKETDIINGAEAEEMELASGSDEDSTPKFDPVRRVLESGQIPDAAMIHAARKRRAQAREMVDFIPLETDSRDGNDKSRLVRDDEHDRSDDDEEDGRIDFTVNLEAREKQRLREAFYSVQGKGKDGGSEEEGEEDEEIERWEQEQIRKGVNIPQVLTAAEVQPYPYQMYNSYPANDSSNYNSSSFKHDRPKSTSVVKSATPQTAESIKIRLKNKLESLKEVSRAHELELKKNQAELSLLGERIVELEEEAPSVARRFTFYQQTRGYVTDLVECLNEKVDRINVLERNMHELMRQRSMRLAQRRQDDIKDQSDEYSVASSKALVAPNMDMYNRNSYRNEEAKVRRAAEREGRRTRRRKAREMRGEFRHYEGMSSDDEEIDADKTAFRCEKERLMQEGDRALEDVIENFCQLSKIRKKFELWKEEDIESYTDAYVNLCLPKIFNPYIRLQLLSWNPIEGDVDMEESAWFEVLKMYGYSDGQKLYDLAGDPDANLLPLIVERTILPKLATLGECSWDPVSTSQTLRFVGLINKLIDDYPTVNGSSKHTKNLLQSIVARMKKSLDDDVFMPLYPKQLLETKTGANTFFQRQFWSCLKLLRNILSWQGILSERQLQELALDNLLNRYIVLALHNSPFNRESIDKCKMIVGVFPRAWFAGLKGDVTMPQLNEFCRYLKVLAEFADKTGFGGPLDDKFDGKDQVKEVIKLLVNIGAMDQALSLGNKFSLKQLKQLITDKR